MISIQGMSPHTISIQVATSEAPKGSTAAALHVTVKDASASEQWFILNGDETPPFTLSNVVVAPGAGTVTATAKDASGNVVGKPIVESFVTGQLATPVIPTGVSVQSGAFTAPAASSPKPRSSSY